MTMAVHDEAAFKNRLKIRHLRGNIWRRFFSLSTTVAILALIALFLNIVNSAFGYVIEGFEVSPTTLAPDGDLNALSEEQLTNILLEYQSRRLPVYIRDSLAPDSGTSFTSLPLGTLMSGYILPEGTENLTIRELTPEQQAQILRDNLSTQALVALVEDQVVVISAERVWTLWDSLTQRAEIERIAAEQYPEGRLVFRSWIDSTFLTTPMSSNAAAAGIRTAILGSIWVMVITILFAFPVGVGAAIYLEEYATDTPLNNLIETNIRNLAGVPSIIYGLLGLAIFVRTLAEFTGGALGGRTVLAAGLTMGLLILPVIIINAQEAIRAVPSSIREASYGLGATKWQTVWNQVLPAAMPGILTGAILALSRAIGETAPLIVIGASTYIITDPSSPLSKFTALPIQIYNWTARPQPEFRSIAAAAIIVLLFMLLSMNATAIILRQRFRRKLTA
ncbi:MAG TPA: phosphate ABC transporter permease PstA [Oceanobacillus sp.]|nr:phosphate ABC transporter permease PstA [Oceanobacillus sp.]